MDTQDLSIAAMGQALRAGTVTAQQLARDALARIAARDPALQAFLLVTETRALEEARRADDELQAGRDRGPLHGIPYALKDIYDTAGIRTTCHSKLRVDHVPVADSVVAAKLTEAGGVLLGKLATHEFAIGGPSFDLPFPPSRNPWNTAHITGGSSSGSATAIAARMVRMAMGSDTGGSIRGPAAWCGLVGIKPTYGRVSRRGVFPLSWTLDHCGPLSRSVEDSAIALQVLAGHDPEDAASADVPVTDYRAGLAQGVGGLRIGVPRGFFAAASMTAPEVAAGIDRTAALLRDAGASVEDVTLPDYALFSAAGRVIMMAEAFAIHQADMQSRLLDYGEITANRFVLGAAITAADYINALRARRELTDAVNSALGRHDALLTASALTTAPRFDAPVDALASASPMQTIPFNVTGHPAMSVPVGLAPNGLPISVQIVGRPFDEAMVFRIGRAIEHLSGWEAVTLPAFAA
ncbi:MAG: amidase [Acetobacteraceae bacterium]|jgi:aspartyl-tRNA(Asn)/glutamyl-tRNA(Gln) amidotransferase subunit A